MHQLIGFCNCGCGRSCKKESSLTAVRAAEDKFHCQNVGSRDIKRLLLITSRELKRERCSVGKRGALFSWSHVGAKKEAAEKSEMQLEQLKRRGWACTHACPRIRLDLGLSFGICPFSWQNNRRVSSAKICTCLTCQILAYVPGRLGEVGASCVFP